MVKNWIILGDEAFEDSEMVWGRVEFSRNQQKNWQSILMDQFNNAIEKSVKVREMINNSNFVDFDFNFFVKPKVTDEEVAEFMKPLEERFKDKTVFYKVSFNREFSWVFINFMNVNFQTDEEKPEVDENISIDENGNPMPKRTGMTVSLRDYAGDWTEYDYRDVRGKVEKDGQYKIILKGREYDLVGIKNPYDDNNEFTSRELTTALKNSFLYFAEVDQNTIIAMPDENYIKEYIDEELKREEMNIEEHIKNGQISEDRIEESPDYYLIHQILNFCKKVLDVIESKEANKFIEQWERKLYDDAEIAIHEILNSDPKDLNEEEIEQLENMLEEWQTVTT